MRTGYLAVKLTSLREDGLGDYLDLYESIAARLGSLADFQLHAPHRVSNPNAACQDGLSARDVYLLDRLQVTHSNVLVACLELASFGVGAEIQLASDYGIPIVGIYYAEAIREPSRLILGMPGLQSRDGVQRIVRYSPGAPGRNGLLEELLQAVADALTQHPAPRLERCKRALRLERRRQELGLRAEDLARSSHVTTGTINILALAGDPFSSWLGLEHVRRAVSLAPENIDEDRVLLPSFEATLRIARVLGLERQILEPPSPAVPLVSSNP